MSEFDTSNKTLSVIGFVSAIVGVALIVAEIILANLVAGFPTAVALVLEIAGLVLAVIAIILTIIALKKQQGIKALAIIGLILGIITVALFIIALAIGFGLILGFASGVGTAVVAGA